MIITKIIQSNSRDFGIYNFSNSGETNWFEFAITIFELKNLNTNVSPIASNEYVTFAKRPKFSVLNTTKAEQTFSFKIENWKTSLKKALLNI